MRVSRLLVISVALALACSGCIRKPAPRPITNAAPAPAAVAMAKPAPVPAVPPPVIMAPPEASAPAAAPPAAAAPTAAMAQASPAAATAMAQVQPEPAYVLDAGDKLRVVVFGQDGLSNSYAVDAAGNITMPLIGAVYARETTTAGLSQAIAGKLRNGYIREPHVAVEIEAYRPFFILGEVTAPGQYPYVPNMTVETAIAIAGGFSPRAEKKRVEVSRAADGMSYRGKVPLGFPLHPGDTILVSERWF
jgi:polysaccharide biosynthesis/export protein